MSSSSSALVLYSASRRIQEENENPPLTGMNLGLQQLTERTIAERTTTRCTTTKLPVPSINNIVGCDITIENIQSTKRELINQGFDLKMDVNKSQKSRWLNNITPLIFFCSAGKLLIIKLLFLIGANCTKLCKNGYWFPMLAAVQYDHLDICKWLFKYGGDAKYQINKETNLGNTPLRVAYLAWHYGRDNEGKTCRWLLQNGGGQHFSSQAISELRIYRLHGMEDLNSNLLVIWMRENIQLHDTFIQFLCGVITMTATTSTLRTISGRGRKRQLKQMTHQEQSLQIIDGHPGVMELIGDYVGLIRGKEIRMLQEFNELIIEYTNKNFQPAPTWEKII